ncbi:MAG: sigma-70 family RNA polymerase sigma factor [Phycisphaerae bacterium]|nr:sigma-70 family RNA polymerase sigma factor [Phycisphaerae bacterium]
MDKEDYKYTEFLKHLLKQQDKLYGYIFALIPNVSIVDDLMQETILVLWDKFDSFQPDTNFYAWAKKIAYYKFINYFEKSSNKNVYFNNEVLEAIEKNTDLIEESNIRLEALEGCLSKLKRADKELIRLKYVEGKTVKEIATGMSRSIHGMYKVMARIHSTLEKCITMSIKRMEGM